MESVERNTPMDVDQQQPQGSAPSRTYPESIWYENTPCELRPVEGKGRGLFARHDLKKGDVLLSAAPYAWAVYEPCKKCTCRYCLRDVPETEVLSHYCKSCKEVWYCSDRCQKLDEAVHFLGGECSLFVNWELDSKVYSNDTVGEMKFLVRCLAHKTYEAHPNYAVPSPPQLLYADYCTLVARKQDFEPSVIEALEYWIVDYIHKLREYLGQTGDTADEVLDILLRNRRNSFYVASQHRKTPAGCAVFITPSFFNHSCKSNVFYHSWPTPHVPRVFEFCADQDLPVGTELCITYLDDSAIVQGYVKRRAMLRESFLFTCMCERCVAEEKAPPPQPPKEPPPFSALFPNQNPSAAPSPASPSPNSGV